jgi:hypothetical protein
VKARKIVQRTGMVYLAKPHVDHIWRFQGGSARFSYLEENNAFIWKSVPVRKSRLATLKEDGWLIVKNDDISEIRNCYVNGEYWVGFPPEVNNGGFFEIELDDDGHNP